jgi:hypothetical protein
VKDYPHTPKDFRPRELQFRIANKTGSRQRIALRVATIDVEVWKKVVGMDEARENVWRPDWYGPLGDEARVLAKAVAGEREEKALAHEQLERIPLERLVLLNSKRGDHERLKGWTDAEIELDPYTTSEQFKVAYWFPVGSTKQGPHVWLSVRRHTPQRAGTQMRTKANFYMNVFRKDLHALWSVEVLPEH